MDIGQGISELLKAPFICIGWIIVGALAGIIAHNIMRSNASLIVDIILGLLGAVVGGFVLNIFGVGRPEGGIVGVIASLIVAVIGGVIIIALWRLIRGRSIT
ncbi:MAG: GlsB/YeaQ/YmgE family stress response membrane protein [Anaerolineae bacterium]|nr:GlsB/YeaQ/YmgE family stress response membrane protein [Anaerolineae bacterium]NUQ05858.1 GlsB/YeaQ/YmgE family stress response membrane protein [Anaerolineae bacterium]